MPPLGGSTGANEAVAFGRRHWNPLLILAISLFAGAGLYAGLVVAFQLQPIYFPGQKPGLGALGSVVPGVGSDPETADIQQRINILVMGLDLRRDEPDDQPARTDSIFVFTIDPYAKTGGIFSIPRDLAVDIPDGSGGYISDRINTAYERGEIRQKGTGPDLAIATVEHNFDIPIDYYAVLNFNNFIQIVDELGGIDVNVPEYVYDPAYNDCNACYYRSVEFLPGAQHMDGETALAYSRLRHSDDDFKRLERQQLVMRAVARKSAGLDWLLSRKAVSLYNEYKSTVKTNVSDTRIPGLALLAKQIGVDSIRMESLADATY